MVWSTGSSVGRMLKAVTEVQRSRAYGFDPAHAAPRRQRSEQTIERIACILDGRPVGEDLVGRNQPVVFQRHRKGERGFQDRAARCAIGNVGPETSSGASFIPIIAKTRPAKRPFHSRQPSRNALAGISESALE
jgi:hypothetical protein